MEKLLQALAEWAIMYSLYAAVDLPDRIILDSSGCAHPWGGETAYLEHYSIIRLLLTDS